MAHAVPDVCLTGEDVMNETVDDLIVGGGLAGASCALALAGAGHRVVLLERESRVKEKLCGEFLGREALHYLEALDIDVTALGAAPIETLRLAAGGYVIDHPLGFTARGLSRRLLDAAVLARAKAIGADIRLGARVEALSQEGAGWCARLRGGESVVAGGAFLATGKHDLRGWKRPRGSRSPLVGLKQHWRLAGPQQAELQGAVELTLFPGGYAGLAPVEDGRANLCLLVSQSRFEAAGTRWDALLAGIRARAPVLDRRLNGAIPCEGRPLAVAAIPFGLLWQDGGGLWRLGDQAAVVPSFTGSGMAVALYSAGLAASCRLQGGTPDSYHRQLARALNGPLTRGMRLSPLMLHAPAQIAVVAAARLVPALIGWGIGATRLPVPS